LSSPPSLGNPPNFFWGWGEGPCPRHLLEAHVLLGGNGTTSSWIRSLRGAPLRPHTRFLPGASDPFKFSSDFLRRGIEHRPIAASFSSASETPPSPKTTPGAFAPGCVTWGLSLLFRGPWGPGVLLGGFSFYLLFPLPPCCLFALAAAPPCRNVCAGVRANGGRSGPDPLFFLARVWLVWRQSEWGSVFFFCFLSASGSNFTCVLAARHFAFGSARSEFPYSTGVRRRASFPPLIFSFFKGPRCAVRAGFPRARGRRSGCESPTTVFFFGGPEGEKEVLPRRPPPFVPEFFFSGPCDGNSWSVRPGLLPHGGPPRKGLVGLLKSEGPHSIASWGGARAIRSENSKLVFLLLGSAMGETTLSSYRSSGLFEKKMPSRLSSFPGKTWSFFSFVCCGKNSRFLGLECRNTSQKNKAGR